MAHFSDGAPGVAVGLAIVIIKIVPCLQIEGDVLWWLLTMISMRWELLTMLPRYRSGREE